MAEVILSVRKLEVRRSGSLVLKGVNLKVEKGGPFAIVGKSGSGKTTLLYTLLGLLRASQGEVRVCGRDPGTLSARDRAGISGLVFQDYALFPHLNVRENLEFAPRRQGREGVSQTATELLEQLGIAELSARYPHELSGGQKQRVAIARSLMLSPQIVFFDEPSAALDLKTTNELASLIARLAKKTQIVVVSHDLPFIRLFCDRGCVMEAGTVRGEGNLEHILSGEPS